MKSKRKSLKYSFLTKLRVVGITLAVLGLACGVYVQALLVRNAPIPYSSFQTPLSNRNSSVPQTKVNFTVSVVCGGHVECEKGTRPLRLAIAYLEKRLDVKFKIEKIITTDKQPLGTIEERWMQWFDIAASLGAAKNDLTVILLEDHPDNIDAFEFQQEGMIGLASGIGVLGIRPSALLAKVMGSEQFMTRILIHEIGHVLGGEHIEEGIMHPCACVNQYSDEYSLYTIAQIKAHLDLVREHRANKKPNSTPRVLTLNPKNAIIENNAHICL